MTGNSASASGRGSRRTDAVIASSMDGASARVNCGSLARERDGVRQDAADAARLDRRDRARASCSARSSRCSGPTMSERSSAKLSSSRSCCALGRRARSRSAPSHRPRRPGCGTRWSAASPSRSAARRWPCGRPCRVRSSPRFARQRRQHFFHLACGCRRSAAGAARASADRSSRWPFASCSSSVAIRRSSDRGRVRQLARQASLDSTRSSCSALICPASDSVSFFA